MLTAQVGCSDHLGLWFCLYGKPRERSLPVCAIAFLVLDALRACWLSSAASALRSGATERDIRVGRACERCSAPRVPRSAKAARIAHGLSRLSAAALRVRSSYDLVGEIALLGEVQRSLDDLSADLTAIAPRHDAEMPGLAVADRGVGHRCGVLGHLTGEPLLRGRRRVAAAHRARWRFQPLVVSSAQFPYFACLSGLDIHHLSVD